MTVATTWPRGLAPWSPRPATLDLLDRVRTVLAEYREHLPLTVRQVFYRLVGAYGYPKTEQGYARLGEHLNRARRAGLIAWDALRDDGITFEDHSGWESPAHLVRTFASAAEQLTLDRQQGQPQRLIFAVEAAGMVPQIARLARPFGIDVHSAGGFDSVTAKCTLAERLGQYDAVEVLHIGDHDPSGVHLFTSMAEDVRKIAADLHLPGDIYFTRLAVTPAQIAEHALPTAPVKPTDRRSFEGETTQAEALPPDVLATIVRDAIERRIDNGAYQAVLAEEGVARRGLASQLHPLLRWLPGA